MADINLTLAKRGVINLQVSNKEFFTLPTSVDDHMADSSIHVPVATINAGLAEKLEIAENLNDLADKATARTNLDVYGKSESYNKTETYSQTEANTLLSGKSDTSHNHTLAGLSEKSYASLTDKPDLTVYAAKAGNLSDLTDKSAALTNIKAAGIEKWAEIPSGYFFDGVDDQIVHSGITFSATTPWTWVGLLNWEGSANSFTVLRGGATDTWGIFIRQSGNNRFAIRMTDDNYVSFNTNTSNGIIGVRSLCAITHNGSGTVTLYIGGVQIDQKTGLNQPVALGCIGSGNGNFYTKCRYYFDAIYNRALSLAEIQNLMNNMRPDLGDVSYADKWGSLTTQTSGTLTLGKRYRIVTFNAGDDFTNVGASSNANGIEFIATGTTPTTWTNSSVIMRIGCMALFNEQSGFSTWSDNSGNGYHGSVVGAAPIKRNKELTERRLAVTANTTLTSIIRSGYLLKTIVFRNNTANAVTVNVGTTAGATDVVNALAVGANAVVVATVQKVFSATANQSLFVHSSAWSSANIDVHCNVELVI
jgi:hypothetical protein